MVYPIKCGYVALLSVVVISLGLIDPCVVFTQILRVGSQLGWLAQLQECHSASEVTLSDMGKFDRILNTTNHTLSVSILFEKYSAPCG